MRVAGHWGAVACAAVLVGCQGTTATLSAGYVQTALSGYVALAPSSPSPNPLKSRRVDLRESLGLDDSEGSLYGRARVRNDRFSLTASGFAHEQSGAGTLSSPFGDLPQGTAVRTTVSVSNAKVALRYHPFDHEWLDLSAGLGASFLRFDVEARAVSQVAFESVENDVTAPIIDLAAEASFAPVSLEANLSWIDADLGDGTGAYIDFDTRLAVTPIECVDLFAGYRWIEVDVNGNAGDRDWESQVLIRGFYLGGSFSFGRPKVAKKLN